MSTKDLTSMMTPMIVSGSDFWREMGIMFGQASKVRFEKTTRGEFPTRFGFRSGDRGTHGSRSIMLVDLRQLLDATLPETTYEGYRVSIMEENVLGKGTASTRLWSWKKLRELYGLNLELTVFRCFRRLWDADRHGQAVLAIFCACARDPLLRMSAATILKSSHGTVVSPEEFAAAIAELAPDRFSSTTLNAMGNRGGGQACVIVLFLFLKTLDIKSQVCFWLL